jgi:hypothetical protein
MANLPLIPRPMLVTDATGEHEIVLEDPALGERTA